jgi:pSer/pThr/pTyr-binding forkhead associated (FHA) protein
MLEANPEAPPIFVPIIERALAQDPNDRYQLMSEFSQVLRETRDQLRSSALATPATPLERDTTSLVDLDEAEEPAIHLKIVTSGQEIVRTQRSELTIGRAYKNNIPDIDLGPYGGSKAGVSRQHSRLIYKDNQWFVEDLVSTNGTFVNGVRIAPKKLVPFKDGDLIRCGQIELELRMA